MLNYKLSLGLEESFKISRSPIVFASANFTTKILGFCTGDSGIVLINVGRKDKIPQTSSIQMDIEYINKFIWLNNYEFVAGGSGGSLKYFSIMNLNEETFEIHTSGISTMKKNETLIFTGSSDGTIAAWDKRNKEVAIHIPHIYKAKPQPIKDLDIDQNYLYSSSIYNGRIWSWDLRSPKKCIGKIETKKCQNYLYFHDGCLYSSNSEGVMRISRTLELNEFFLTLKEPQQYTTTIVKHANRFNSLIFNSVDSIYVKSTSQNDPVYFNKFKENGITGFELFGSDEIITYRSDGVLSIHKIKIEIDN